MLKEDKTITFDLLNKDSRNYCVPSSHCYSYLEEKIFNATIVKTAINTKLNII